jgi:hypothetical protein
MGLDLIAIKDAFFLHILQRSLSNTWNGLGNVFECSDTVLMPLVIMNLSHLLLLMVMQFLISCQSHL